MTPENSMSETSQGPLADDHACPGPLVACATCHDRSRLGLLQLTAETLRGIAAELDQEAGDLASVYAERDALAAHVAALVRRLRCCCMGGGTCITCKAEPFVARFLAADEVAQAFVTWDDNRQGDMDDFPHSVFGHGDEYRRVCGDE